MEYKIIESKNYLEIQKQYNINPLLAKVIDYNQYKDLNNFVNPRLIYHDFSLLEESDMALDRIFEAIENQEKICIYGDYDCDGILATTILVQAFLELGVQVGYHIPDRFSDGYGLNVHRVEQMAEKGYSLIITVDNGVKAFEAIDRANELGIDVIITDHHQYDQELPDACCILHTKLSPDYPFKEISGGFLAYKLAVALLERQDKYLYCLAAITTISDMMPLFDENRSLVKKALQFMQEEKYESLELLLGQQKYSAKSIGFTIAPKINSFGRMPEIVQPNILVKYFLKNATKDLKLKVSSLATTVNNKRQSITNKQYNDIPIDENMKFLYYGNQHIHEGIVGLIAGKYTRQYEKPSFVMKLDAESGIYKGSARSVDGFSLHDFFNKHKDCLLTFGGHALAGGFSLHKSEYDHFYRCIENELCDKELHSIVNVLLLDEYDLSVSYIESLSILEPFGMSNEEPIFCLNEILIDKVVLLSQGKHIKLEFMLPHGRLDAMLFNQGHLYNRIKDLKRMSLAGKISINEFNGNKTMNMLVEHIL